MKHQNGYKNNMALSSNSSQINDVDSIFMSSCWQNSDQSDYAENTKLMLNSTCSDRKPNKLLIDSAINHEEEIESKESVEAALDGLLLSGQNMSLAELKPLPPFSGFSANININGISGHHYQAISQQIAEENNNNYTSYNEQNIVSSSTCNNVNSNEKITLYDAAKLSFSDCIEADSVNSDIKFEGPESEAPVKAEIGEYDISSIEDIAAIIGSAIADTTVTNQPESDELTCSRDSWMDLDAWIDNACGEQKNVLSSQDAISEFLIPNNNNNNNSVPNNNTINEYDRLHIEYSDKTNNNSSTLHSLLSQNNMPLLQYRLENGPPIKQENSNYTSDIVSTSSSPSDVVSTTDNLLLSVNGQFMSQYGLHIINENPRISSSDILGQNYPHTTTSMSNASPKKPRRPPKKHSASSTTIFTSEQAMGLLGKEKPVHRCSICNRGFLNKSNIKVHLRTHTGEKPFRCDTCAKAFRQKAHLLKHQQIHKRIGRD